MGLFFQKKNFEPDKPHTHALVIGVGAYPHLVNGKSYKTNPAPISMGLGQLSSPPVSALAFANWLKDRHRNDLAPLATLDLLISENAELLTESKVHSKIRRPTISNIQSAFDTWVARCDTHPDNVAILYFCGHGLAYSVMALLAEDFGKDANRPWENAINFHQTYFGMNACKAQTQCYFIDACRDAPREILRSNDFAPRVLKTSGQTKLKPRSAPVMISSLQGGQAYAKAGEVSYFTQALIRTLDNFGASRKVGRLWHVTTDSLPIGLKYALGREGLLCSIEGESQLANKVIHQISDPVQCLVHVGCSPEELNKAAQFIMTQQHVAQPRIYKRDKMGTIEPWQTQAESGIYHVQAQFESSIPGPLENPAFVVYPPEQFCPLELP